MYLFSIFNDYKLEITLITTKAIFWEDISRKYKQYEVKDE
ncbi:hypothetical protein RD055328_07110 [Companilactobacillus sp. RD055328]|nr:hypothetical protein RD055328_07110 [Companilactobacillus sp. RD055328]